MQSLRDAASAGGTGQYYQANNTASLQQALSSIGERFRGHCVRTGQIPNSVSPLLFELNQDGGIDQDLQAFRGKRLNSVDVSRRGSYAMVTFRATALDNSPVELTVRVEQPQSSNWTSIR